MNPYEICLLFTTPKFEGGKNRYKSLEVRNIQIGDYAELPEKCIGWIPYPVSPITGRPTAPNSGERANDSYWLGVDIDDTHLTWEDVQERVRKQFGDILFWAKRGRSGETWQLIILMDSIITMSERLHLTRQINQALGGDPLFQGRYLWTKDDRKLYFHDGKKLSRESLPEIVPPHCKVKTTCHSESGVMQRQPAKRKEKRGHTASDEELITNSYTAAKRVCDAWYARCGDLIALGYKMHLRDNGIILVSSPAEQSPYGWFLNHTGAMRHYGYLYESNTYIYHNEELLETTAQGKKMLKQFPYDVRQRIATIISECEGSAYTMAHSIEREGATNNLIQIHTAAQHITTKRMLTLFLKAFGFKCVPSRYKGQHTIKAIDLKTGEIFNTPQQALESIKTSFTNKTQLVKRILLKGMRIRGDKYQLLQSNLLSIIIRVKRLMQRIIPILTQITTNSSTLTNTIQAQAP